MTASVASEMSMLGTQFWILTVVGVLLGAGAGFAAGLFYARRSEDRAFQRARTGVAQLYQTVIASLETAQDVCALLEKHTGMILKPAQTEQLEKKRSRLFETIAGLVKRHESPAELATVVEAKPEVQPLDIEWLLEPEDAATGLPGRKAFDANLAMLSQKGNEVGRDSGLLLLKIDKFENLRSRLGVPDTDKLMKKLTNIVCLSVRDKDLVCRYAGDMLAVLLPDTDTNAGGKIAGAVRDSVRAYHFRVEEHGPEVFVTASFGYTICQPQDNPELVVNRGADALSKSQQRGRNQLHAHNGQAVKHCLAG